MTDRQLIKIVKKELKILQQQTRNLRYKETIMDLKYFPKILTLNQNEGMFLSPSGRWIRSRWIKRRDFEFS